MRLVWTQGLSGLWLCLPQSVCLSVWLKLNLPAMQGTWVWSLGQEDSLEKGMANQSSIPAWRMPWTEDAGRLQSMGSQRVRHDWATNWSSETETGPGLHTHGWNWSRSQPREVRKQNHGQLLSYNHVEKWTQLAHLPALSSVVNFGRRPHLLWASAHVLASNAM